MKYPLKPEDVRAIMKDPPIIGCEALILLSHAVEAALILTGKEKALFCDEP